MQKPPSHPSGGFSLRVISLKGKPILKHHLAIRLFDRPLCSSLVILGSCGKELNIPLDAVSCFALVPWEGV